MKNKVWLALVLCAIVAVAIYHLVVSGKQQIVEVQKSEALAQEKIKLCDSVKGLTVQKEKSLDQLKVADSLVQEQVGIINQQQYKIATLDQETRLLKKQPKEKLATALKPEIIYVHDTVIITEKKNFWGKTKKTVTSTQSIDSVFSKEETDSLSVE